jgi:hypothetical protein
MSSSNQHNRSASEPEQASSAAPLVNRWPQTRPNQSNDPGYQPLQDYQTQLALLEKQKIDRQQMSDLEHAQSPPTRSPSDDKTALLAATAVRRLEPLRDRSASGRATPQLQHVQPAPAPAAQIDGILRLPSVDSIQTIPDSAQHDCRNEKRTWLIEGEEVTIDQFRAFARPLLARKKSSDSLRRKRSYDSINTEAVSKRTPSEQPRDQNSVSYRHPRYEGRLSECGSFMNGYEGGLSAESIALCQRLLKSPQSPPKDSLFEDEIFENTLVSIKGRNKTRVIRDIAQLIVPPAEILALRGIEHLKTLRETTSAGWDNTIPFYGPRPQPHYSLGFKREAFTQVQLQKLQPFVGNGLEDCSYFATTYDMYFPFFTSEVECGASALEVADRKNAHSQTVGLRGLIELFRLAGRENEVHREINGFSISHSDEYVRVWGHYAVVNGRDSTFHRHIIANFNISNSRWAAYTFVRNVYDLWLPEHFSRICSVIDLLPADLK